MGMGHSIVSQGGVMDGGGIESTAARSARESPNGQASLSEELSGATSIRSRPWCFAA